MSNMLLICTNLVFEVVPVAEKRSLENYFHNNFSAKNMHCVSCFISLFLSLSLCQSDIRNISNKKGIYELSVKLSSGLRSVLPGVLPSELPYELRLRILGN